MPSCTNCSYKWKAKEVLKLGFSKSGKDCPSCGKRQYISGETQRLFTLGFLSILVVPFLLFFIKLSDEDEPIY